MTHNELLTLCLGYHIPVMIAVIAAYYKYGDRTEIFVKSLQGADATLSRLRQRIAADLAKKLQPIFENSGAVSVLLVPEAYVERIANPVGSEIYRESLREFLETSVDAVIDYRTLHLSRNSWCFWAKLLSWSILFLMFWQMIVVGALSFIDKVGGAQIPDVLLKWSALPTGVAVLCCLLPLPCMLRHHDIITGYRAHYDSP